MTQRATSTSTPAATRSGRPSPAGRRAGSSAAGPSPAGFEGAGFERAGFERAGFDVAGTAFLGHPVVLTVDGPDRLLGRARAQLDRLAALWDVRRSDSDLHRLLVRPACALEVSAETVLLARSALADDALRARLGLLTDGGGVVHAGHNRVGLLPASAARAGQLLLACAVDLLAEQLQREGARRGIVRVGSTTRAFGVAVPAVCLDLPGLSREVVLEDDALAVAVRPSYVQPSYVQRSYVRAGAVARDEVVAVAVHAPGARQAQSLADAALLLPGGKAVGALAASARGGLVLHPGGGWTSTSGAREQLGHR